MQGSLLCHAVVMGGQHSDRILPVQVSRDRAHDHRALFRVCAAREFIQQDHVQPFRLFPAAEAAVAEHLVEAHNLRTEARKAAIHVFQILRHDMHAVKQRHARALCKRQYSCGKRKRVKRDGFERNALTAHVRAGDHGRALPRLDGNRGERALALRERVHDARVHHVLHVERTVRKLRHHAAIAPRKACARQREIEHAERIHAGEDPRQKRPKRFGEHGTHNAFLLILRRGKARAFRHERGAFRLRFRPAQFFLHKAFFLAGGAQHLGICIRDKEGRRVLAVKVKQLERLGLGNDLDAEKLRLCVDLRKHRGDQLGLQQKALHFKQFHLVEGPFGAALHRTADVLELHHQPLDASVFRRAFFKRVHHHAHVPEVRKQRLLLMGSIKAQLAHPCVPIGGITPERIHDITKADVFLLCKVQAHCISSFPQQWL